MDEFKPDHVIKHTDDPYRMYRLLLMLVKNRAPILGNSTEGGGKAMSFDGKAYLITDASIEIWDHYVFLNAVAKKIIPFQCGSF